MESLRKSSNEILSWEKISHLNNLGKTGTSDF